MDVERIRECYYADPFQPFILQLNDGRNLSVMGRDFIAIAPNGREVIVGHPDDDSFAVIDLELVRDLAVHQ